MRVRGGGRGALHLRRGTHLRHALWRHVEQAHFRGGLGELGELVEDRVALGRRHVGPEVARIDAGRPGLFHLVSHEAHERGLQRRGGACGWRRGGADEAGPSARAARPSTPSLFPLLLFPVPHEDDDQARSEQLEAAQPGRVHKVATGRRSASYPHPHLLTKPTCRRLLACAQSCRGPRAPRL